LLMFGIGHDISINLTAESAPGHSGSSAVPGHN
jgi:hypothetical protein